jgi:hypothetical protein
MNLTKNETNASDRNYEITRQDLTKNKALLFGAWSSPIILSVIPALIFFVLFIFSSLTPTAAFFLFMSGITFFIGLFIGLLVSAGLLVYRKKWMAQIREKLAVDGIKTEEVEWFKHELTSAERKSLKELENQDRLLGDAFRETLASRLTATRIIKSAKNELLLVKRRESKLKMLKSDTSAELQTVLKDDREKLEDIRKEAEQMRVEAETRLQLIEAASRRGNNFVDTEIALKKLSSRASELPLALEALKMEEEMRKELELMDNENNAK